MLGLTPGTVVHDRYRVVRPVGKGGMGAVYEAVDLRLHNTVALKRMTAEGAEADRAFEHEAQLLASLRNSGLPAVIDYFLAVESRFLVMQYIEGEDLEHVRRRQGGCCRDRDVTAWGVEVLNVLAFLHRHDPPIVHRDVKPANLKLTPRGEIVLLDFGLAKGSPDSTTRLGAEHSLYGFTESYAPAEQQQGRSTDARSDIYALGATLYHLVAGVPPVPAERRAAALAAGLPDPLPRAHIANLSVSRGLSEVLLRAMEVRADARFQTAEDMREALANLRHLEAESPRGLETHGTRRLDAAIPSQAEVGRQVDLIVQVRFAGSPRLGLEDWPSKRPPEKIEQASETFELEYPINPRTQQTFPARLRVKIVAPDFTIEGTAECLTDVPPQEYSKRLAFLLTPRRVGVCRVNVEVYAGDALHLGTVPIEAEAVASVDRDPVVAVAHLVLGVMSRDRSRVAPLFEINIDEQSYGVPRFVEPSDLASILREGGEQPNPSTTPAVEATATGVTARGVPRWVIATTPLVVAVIAAVVLARMGPQSPALLSTARVTTTIGSEPMPTPPSTDPSLRARQMDLEARLRANLAAAANTPSSSPTVVSTPTPTSATTSRALARSTADSGIELSVLRADRSRRGVVRLDLLLKNVRPQPVKVSIRFADISLTVPGGERLAVSADSHDPPAEGIVVAIPAGGEFGYGVEFAIPDETNGLVTLTLAHVTQANATEHLATMSFALPARVLP